MSVIHFTCERCGVKNAVPVDALGRKTRCGKCREPLDLLLPAQPIAVDSSSFQPLVIRSERPVLVDFWAAWCGPCQAIAPSLERLAREFAGRLSVVKVNTDENPVLSQTFQIRSIPTLILFEGGQIKAQVTGALPFQQLRVWLQKSMGWL